MIRNGGEGPSDLVGRVAGTISKSNVRRVTTKVRVRKKKSEGARKSSGLKFRSCWTRGHNFSTTQKVMPVAVA